MIKLFNLVCLNVVLQATLVIFSDEVPVRTVQEDQVVDVLWRGLDCSISRLGWLETIHDLADELKGSFSLALHQEDYTLREYLICYKLLLSQFEVTRSLQVIVCLIKVFLLNLYFGDFVQSRAREVIIVISSDHLLEVEDSIAEVIQLLERLCFVEIGTA